ncbi:MAG: inorganic phosphate transporter [Nocardioides sp.]
MTTLTLLAVIAIVFVVLFDYTNGFHDASNIIATVIASRAMTPIQAVCLVAFFEFLGPVLGGTAVANTVGKFVDVSSLPPERALMVTLCGIIGAITWNLGTWAAGIPSSSSHALVGGLVGAVVVSAGPSHVVWGFAELAHGEVHGVTKVLLGLVLSPIIGFWAGFIIHKLMSRLLSRARPSANGKLRRAQWVTSAWLAFSHGANDAQKSMGIITMVLVLGGFITDFLVPFWVILTCATAITLGILSGGWRIVRTVGFGIYKVRPLHALDAQLTSASVIYVASLLGAPVSTTHVVSSSIMGIGSSEHPKWVRWSKAKEIVSTWVITIPGAGLVSILAYGVVWLIWR